VKPRVTRGIFWLLFVALVALRLPSLQQPAGADQGLYGYVGQRILHGEVPYRDAWDQKPPGIHATYAILWAIWPDERVVAAADLAAAIATTLLLLALGRRLGPPGAGEIAALVFLFLGDPAWGRLGGVRARGQSEVFIGLVATFGFLMWRRAIERTTPPDRTKVYALLAGLAFGEAFVYKYNAGAVLGAALLAAIWWRRADPLPLAARLRALVPAVAALAVGFAAIVAGMLAIFAVTGALDDLYHATISYNVFYSGETYASRLAMLTYLLRFPIEHARVDGLWFAGGLGCAIILVTAILRGGRADAPDLAPVLWVAAACLAIAVNGSRGLPQYFLQAAPGLALAFGVALAWALPRMRPVARVLAIVVISVCVQRVVNFDKLFGYLRWDLSAWTGERSREDYLARFGGRDTGDKFSALAVRELAAYLRANTAPDDTVLLLGFSPGALLQAERRSATRFFWSRPLIVGFGEGWPGYGVQGLLDELQANRPALVVLQRRDWDPDTIDSYTWFFRQPALVDWLKDGYEPAGELGNFAMWRRTSTEALP
jgi:4-amino-4-deoxy-L-arabinose transferase-like glycosyltransferase